MNRLENVKAEVDGISYSIILQKEFSCLFSFRSNDFTWGHNCICRAYSQDACRHFPWLLWLPREGSVLQLRHDPGRHPAHVKVIEPRHRWRHWRHSQRSRVKLWLMRQHFYAMHTVPNLFFRTSVTGGNTFILSDVYIMCAFIEVLRDYCVVKSLLNGDS
jgi:hypothetical protein